MVTSECPNSQKSDSKNGKKGEVPITTTKILLLLFLMGSSCHRVKSKVLESGNSSHPCSFLVSNKKNPKFFRKYSAVTALDKPTAQTMGLTMV